MIQNRCASFDHSRPKTCTDNHGINSEQIFCMAILNGWIKVAFSGSRTIFLEQIWKSKNCIVAAAEEADSSSEGEREQRIQRRFRIIIPVSARNQGF